MNIHFLQHVPFEGLAGIASWVDAHGHDLTGTRLYAGEALPNFAEFDCLIVMGGPMGVHDEGKYPWLIDEKRFLEKAIRVEKTVLGVCLGTQLIASVLGANVYRNRFKEIGWLPVRLTDDGLRSRLFNGFEEQFMAFHWHGDTFDIPHGAVQLARSEGCEHQVFSYGEHVLGLQLHLDSTAESIELLLRNCGDEIVPGPFIQPAEQIRGGFHHICSIQKRMSSLLHRLTGRESLAEPVRERKTIRR